MNNLRINRILRYFKAKGTGENPFRELDALKETALRDTKLMSEANIQRLVDKKAISNNPSIPWDVENKGSDAIKAFKLEVARDQYAEIIARHQLFAKNRTVKLEV